MNLLKQSTAATIEVGPVLDADGAAVTTAVVGDFSIDKNGTKTALAAAATATHSANGMYHLALTTGNTDTIGRVTISVNNAAMGMASHRYEVLSAAVFDALTGTTWFPPNFSALGISAGGIANANAVQWAGVNTTTVQDYNNAGTYYPAMCLKWWLDEYGTADNAPTLGQMQALISDTQTAKQSAEDAATNTTNIPYMIANSGTSSAWTGTAMANAPTGGLTQQQVADALKLAPATGSAATGSVYNKLDAIKSKTDVLTGETATIVGPVLLDGQLLVLVRGDDYTDGRIYWTIATTSLPDMTGATVTFTARKKNANSGRGGDVTATVAVTVATSGANTIFTAPLTATQTATMDVGEKVHVFDVQIMRTGSKPLTPILGYVTVREDQTR